MVIVFKKETNSELLEKRATNGDSARAARCLQRVYVGDDMNETMGLRGIQAYESSVAHTAMVCDLMKILIYNRDGAIPL